MDTVTLSERLSPREMTPEEKLVAVDKALALSLQNYKPDVYISYEEYVDMFRHVLFLEEEIRTLDYKRTEPAALQESYIGGWTPSRVSGTYFREGVAPDGSKFTEIIASAAMPRLNDHAQDQVNFHEAN